MVKGAAVSLKSGRGVIMSGSGIKPGVSTYANSGNKYLDGRREKQVLKLNELVLKLAANPDDVADVQTYYEQQKRMQAVNDEIGVDADKQHGASTISSMSADFKTQWIKKESDITRDEIIQIDKTPEAANIIMSFALQMGIRQPLPISLRNPEVMARFFDERAVLCGGRIATIRATAFPVGKLEMKAFRSFDVKYDVTGMLASIEYLLVTRH